MSDDRNEVLEEAAKVAEGSQSADHFEAFRVANFIAAEIRFRKTTTPEPSEMADNLERWADIQDDDAAIVACGDRWKAVASLVGCQLHGFNDGRTASFTTPDGNVIEVGPKFRKAIVSLRTPDPVLEVAKEALEPFASYEHRYISDPGVEDEYEPADTPHCLGQYRRARTALQTINERAGS